MSDHVFFVAYRQPACANGFLSRAPTWAGDATDGQADVCIQNSLNINSHFCDGSFTHRAMLFKGSGFDHEDVAEGIV